ALANVLTGRLAFHNTLRSLFPLPRADQEIALSCLARVGLADKALSRVDKLSGGQQQRVGIARALAQQPAIILADEPVASLDPATSVRVLGLLRDICKEDGITAIVSLHQLEYARRFADRVVGLADSQIVFDAAPSELTDAQLERIYAGRSTTQPANAPAEPPVMLAPSLEMSR
ncbi:ATP-binding cassette domain-containing protein, partial [Pseudomonas sp. S4_EA_1b]|uniref:ATP-binding cassette domain-containing protein n=1 Tax=Pseudomonas sp. S4_EA_1b TaxID=2796960 RepID=UPI0018E63B98